MPGWKPKSARILALKILVGELAEELCPADRVGQDARLPARLHHPAEPRGRIIDGSLPKLREL